MSAKSIISDLLWALGAAIAAAACGMIAPLTTPIDRALPVIAATLVAVAWIVRETRWWPAVLCGVPMLVCAVAAFPAEQGRLLAYGAVVALTYCGALAAARPLGFRSAAGFVVAGVALLRWIARQNVELSREAVILAGAILVVAVMRKSPLAVAVALGAALASPGVPAKTMLVPLVLACAAALIRVRMTVAPLLLIAIQLLLFPWSGVVARAFPYFFRSEPIRPRVEMNRAIAPGESVDFDVPPRSRTVLVSVANGLTLRRGTVVGTIDGRPMRMGEVADWGASRRQVWWRARVPVADRPAGGIRAWGYDAWVGGAGRVPIPDRPRIRITAKKGLPPNFRVQVEGFER